MRRLEEELDKALFDTDSFRLIERISYHEKPLEASGDFSIGRKVISRVKYADGLVLLAEEETVLQGMVNRLIETGR